jgi:hypothetical protein
MAVRQAQAQPARRALLAGTIAAAGSAWLAGCKGIAALGPPPGVPSDVRTLEQAIAAEEALVALYKRATRQLAGSSAVIAVIGAEHEAHLGQLRARLILPPRLAGTKIGASRGLPPLPADQAGALGALAAQERAAAARLTGQLADAPAGLAKLLAAISASEAAHVVYLRRAGSG